MTLDPERDGEMRALLRASVGAPRVDPARAARVRGAVHEEWVRARAARPALGRRWAGLAAAAVLVLGVAGAFIARPWQRPAPPLATGAATPLATVAYVAGPATGVLGDGGTTTAVRAGDVLTAGAEIVTGGEAAGRDVGLTLTLADGAEVRVGGLSHLVLRGRRRFELRGGALYVDTGTRQGADAPESLEIQTAGAIIRDIGTRFLVHGGSAVRVKVRDGRVQLEQGGVRYDAGAGEGLTVTPNGRVTRDAAARFGPEWEWIVGATRPPAVDGRTLAEFLAWVEREGGRSVRFADAAVGRDAGQTRVYGAIDGLSVVEALEVVLPSCGLTHRVEGGVITIVAGDDAGAERR